MNVFVLKIIALVSMIIDHYGAIFHEGTDIYRIIGRLAFPIYCFLLVEGYMHTKDVKKYGIRLFIFALISEIPFDYAFYGKIGFSHQNIFFTLLIGLVTIYILDNKEEKFNYNKSLVIGCAVLLATFFFVDYSFIGIVYILAFYYYKELPKAKRLQKVGLVLLVTNLLAGIAQQFSLLSLPIIYLYNGELGPKNKALQMLFYIAYPLHLAIFYLL
ncbi:TraX family protein [Tissierella sp.]|uniref:TraX family protein n=1 Tax=Tissierella sp. TaxID=41274 RepID=UPI00285BB373|nr:TraX family protein [Tissierella sp.]MDR7855456.1 TraX family protein [Tissierella sp.]